MVFRKFNAFCTPGILAKNAVICPKTFPNLPSLPNTARAPVIVFFSLVKPFTILSTPGKPLSILSIGATKDV